MGNKSVPFSPKETLLRTLLRSLLIKREMVTCDKTRDEVNFVQSN